MEENGTNLIIEIQGNYQKECLDFQQKRKELESKVGDCERKILWHQNRIKRLKASINNLHRPHWLEDYVRPILIELARLTPNIAWDFEALRTFGMRAECPVFGKTNEGFTVGITFTIGTYGLYYDTGEYKREFAGNTLGDLNGFNNVTAPVDSMETLLSLINCKIEKEKEHLSQVVEKES